MLSKRTDGIVSKVIVVLVIVVIAVACVKTIKVGDFWWHLASGRWIVENGALPDSDPFSYTSGDIQDDKKVFLTAYWIVQIAMYATVKLFGFHGIVVLASMIFTSIFAILYVLMRKRGLGRPLSLILIISIVLVMRKFLVFRPLIVSFPMTLLLFAALDRMRSQADAFRDYRLLVGIPIAMAIWSNMHGAYIVGAAMILIYAGCELIDSIRSGIFGVRFRVIFAVSAIAILACGLNPIGFEMFGLDRIFALVERSESYEKIMEFYSPYKLYRSTGNASYLYSVIAATTVLLLSLAVNLRRMNLFYLAVASMFTFAGWISFRYGAYFFMFTVLLTAYSLAHFRWARSEDIRMLAIPAVAALVLLQVVWPSSWRALQTNILPTEAVSFIRNSGAPKRLFSTYSWGGYLQWSLYPEYRTFIDGRNLSEEVFREYGQLKTGGEGTDAMMKNYRINTVLLYIVDTADKRILPLLFHLLNSTEWDLAYMDRLSIIFTRKGYGRTVPLSKERAWESLIGFGIAWTKAYPGRSISHSQLGKIYYFRGMYPEAIESFSKALSIDPNEWESSYYMEVIRNSPYGRRL